MDPIAVLVLPTTRTAPHAWRPRHRLGRALALLTGAGLCLLLVAPSLAADPSPTPSLDFPKPQEIVAVDHIEWLGEAVQNNPYMLASKDDEVSPGNYDYKDATGGIFHFYGHDLAGPFAKRTDVCPFIVAHQLLGLSTGVWNPAIPAVLAAECVGVGTAALASVSPSGSDSPAPVAVAAGGGVTPGSTGAGLTAPSTGADDPIALEIAIALICLALGIGGLKVLGVALGLGPFASRPPSLLDEGAPLSGSNAIVDAVVAQPGTIGPSHDQAQQPADPCAAELSALNGVSAHARGLNSVLAGLRDFAAQLDQQIVLLEQAAIPAEIGVETAFLAGGAIGGAAGPGWIPDILLGKIVEGVAKDQLKGVIKTSLANAAVQAPAGGTAAADVRDSAAQATLKGMLEESLSNHYLAESIKGYHTSATAFANSLPDKFAAADRIGGHMADAVGHLITLYGAGMNLETLVQQSAILRQQQAVILNDIAGVEGDFGNATERMTGLAQDLQRCRWVHSPTKEPLRLGAKPAP
jgi:hypothetical protein